MGGRIIKSSFWEVGELLGGKIIIFGKIWGGRIIRGSELLEAVRYCIMIMNKNSIVQSPP